MTATGSSANPDKTDGSPGESAPSSSSSSSSKYPAELSKLLEVYCGRCQEMSARLRTVVSEREALSTSTLAYLRSGRGGGAGVASVAGSGGARGRGAGGAVRKSARGSAVWGGEGERAGSAGTLRQACCAKCTGEVRVCVLGVDDDGRVGAFIALG